jgi:hypothetical protein
MELNQLSLILFALHLLFYFAMSFAILSSPSLWKFFVVFIAWAIQQAAYIYYGIVTEQSGFVLIGITEIIFVLGLFIMSGRVVRDNFKP